MTVDANQRRLVRPVGHRAQRSPISDVQRLRDDAPMHDNEAHDFYPLSRFDDVNRALGDHQIFSFAKRVDLEILKYGSASPKPCPARGWKHDLEQKRAAPVSTTGQISWPPQRSLQTITGQFLNGP